MKQPRPFPCHFETSNADERKDPPLSAQLCRFSIGRSVSCEGDFFSDRSIKETIAIPVSGIPADVFRQAV